MVRWCEMKRDLDIGDIGDGNYVIQLEQFGKGLCWSSIDELLTRKLWHHIKLICWFVKLWKLAKAKGSPKFLSVTLLRSSHISVLGFRNLPNDLEILLGPSIMSFTHVLANLSRTMPRTYGGGCEFRLAFTYMHLPFSITLQPFGRHRPPWRWHPLACIFALCRDATGNVKIYLKAMDKN